MLQTILLIQHAEPETAGLFGAAMREAGASLRLVRTHAGDDVPRAPDDFGGIVVMGGPMGVGDAARLPHIDREIALLRRALRRELPVLGVCLGSQILAAAAGSRVFPGRSKEIGWHPIHLTEEGRRDPLLGALPDPSAVFHWHGDTFDLPPGATLLASSDAYPHQAFRIGSSAYGLQFHLEVTAGMVEKFVEAGVDEVQETHGPGGAARLVGDARRHAPPLESVARRLAVEFLRIGRILLDRPPA
jgi:GMP synthase-like glutamine amidotransferase